MTQQNLKLNAIAGERADLADLCDVKFDDSFVRRLPGDPVTTNVPRAVRGASYTRVAPTPVRAPRLLAWAEPVGEMLGISPPGSPVGLAADVLGGNHVLPGMQPYAARYGGHQFGHWAGQLGDGRAITLGEILHPVDRRFELQLKGAGRTPYSRTADGRAVLRSSVREFLCSEAMHYLGVPTTRALSLVATGESVVRDMFYDGNPQPEMGAIVCRVAPSFIRFGSFEILAAQDEPDILKRLADYVICEHFPELKIPSSSTHSLSADVSAPSIYARWFEEICRRTGLLVAHWMRVGFVHGVMNTDNMSVLGLTMDYGPYGWLEGFDFQWTPNTTDAQGRRYCFGNQAQIAQWNLIRLANALAPLIEDQAALERGLAVYGETFNDTWREMLANKLGFASLNHGDDDVLISELFDLLQQIETDMTLFFRALMEVPVEDTSGSTAGKVRNSATDNSANSGNVGHMDDRALAELFRRAFYDEQRAFEPAQIGRLAGWLRRYIARIHLEDSPPDLRRQRMSRANPKYVLRNYLAQQAIEALEQGDASVITRLMEVLKRPYDEQPEHDELANRRPEWARHKAGCSALSCSS